MPNRLTVNQIYKDHPAYKREIAYVKIEARIMRGSKARLEGYFTVKCSAKSAVQDNVESKKKTITTRTNSSTQKE